MKRYLYLVALMALSACAGNVKNDEQSLEEKAKALHAEMVTIDTHTDTPLNFLREGFDFSGENNSAIGSKVDLRKMEEGGLDAAFFAVFIGQRECTPEGYKKANEKALKIFNAIHESVAKYSDRAEVATSPDDVYRLKKEGKRAIYIGVENGFPIGEDLDQVKRFYDMGARYITLCHTRNNQICDSSTDPDGPKYNGLSNFGRKVVAEMNRLGMMIDVSHISDSSFYDVLALSKAPVIASHSCARAVCDHPRNLSDEMLRAIAKNGGVVQMCILSDYVKISPPNPARDSAYRALREKWNNFRNLTPEQEKQATSEWYKLEEQFPGSRATVSDVVDHIDHMVKVMGIDHVGIGTDFDGGGGVEGCRDASEMYHITMELIKRGYSDKDIRKIWGENFLRVFREVQKHKE
ncbi:MAG: rane dipeptidase [Tenuifilum sp.]|uniref:dipeptidase n=1 Tax=Tenuifilum sp. TaxID=2760880 RepID=UPI0024AB46F1|nr:dipeptidase [Tenuifilum sp.]MDI3526728.1 rane dipeptidase [Tenuifilum sp.]